MDSLGVRLHIARHRDLWIKPQHVAFLLLRPQRKSGHNGRAAVMREFDKGRSRAGLPAEEIDKHALFRSRVLIDQNSDCTTRFEGAQDFASGFLLPDDVIAGQTAPALDKSVDARMIERPDHDMHRPGHQRMGVGAQLPITEVSCRNENSASLCLCRGEVLQPFVADPLVNILFIDSREFYDAFDHASDGAKHSVDDLFAIFKTR